MSRTATALANSPAPPRPGVTGRVWRRGRTSLILHPRLIAVTAVLLAVVAALAAFALTIGTLPIPVSEVVRILLGGEAEAKHVNAVLEIRLPRVVTAVFVGAALGVAGAVFQSVSRNALGSPDVIGFTTGAATGAIVQIVVFQGGAVAVAVSAVLGGLGTALIVYLLSVKGGVTGGYRLVLVGIGVGAALSALDGLLLVKGDLDNAIEANLWLAGSLGGRKWVHALPVLAGVLLLTPIIAATARRLSLIEMGDDLARQLGVRVERTRLTMILCAVLLTGLATAAAGPIAFIALAAPQLVVRLTASRSMPVWSAAAMGAFLLVFADVATQLIPFNATVPIGRMTGIVGGLYLIWLLTRSRQL